MIGALKNSFILFYFFLSHTLGIESDINISVVIKLIIII